MFNSMMNEVARKRASFIRDVEYIKENIKDSQFQEALLLYESCGDGLRLESDIFSKEEDAEIKKAIESFPVDDDTSEREVDRILTSKKPALSIDEIIEIHDDISGDNGSSMDEISVMVNPEDDASEDFTEGANWDMHKEFKEIKKEYKNAIKLAKKNFAKGRHKEAKEALDNADDILKHLEFDIKRMDGSNASAMIGMMAGTIQNCIKATLWGIPTFGIGSVVASIKNLMQQTIVIVNSVIEKKEMSMQDFNYYRNNLLIKVKKLQDKVKMMKKKVVQNNRYNESVEREIIQKYDLYITEDF